MYNWSRSSAGRVNVIAVIYIYYNSFHVICNSLLVTDIDWCMCNLYVLYILLTYLYCGVWQLK